MKKLIMTLTFAMLSTHLPAPIGFPQPILSISKLTNSNMQILAVDCEPFTDAVLETTTNFVDWTAMSTNTVPPNGKVTNIVENTNVALFYRVVLQ